MAYKKDNGLSYSRCFNTTGKLSLLLVLCASLSACTMVGPDFKTPAAPKTSSYVKLPLPNQTAATPSLGKPGGAQHFDYGGDIPAQWWVLYRSPELNKLICQAFANNPSLASAKATLKQAQETLMAQVGTSLYPAISTSLSGQRQDLSLASTGVSGNSLFNLYSATVNVSYNLDIFGGLHRQIEALAAQVDYQRFELEAAYLSLSSNIVTTVVNIASLQAQIQATKELVAAEEQQLVIIKKQLSLGGVSGTNVLAQVTQVAQTGALLPPLEQNLATARHSLAVLVGQLPSEMTVASFDLNKLVLPTQLPLSIPSKLVQQRPDIRASEALLKAASAQVGVATANLYPQVTLSGSYGYSGLELNNLFSKDNNAWGLGGQLLQPIFQGGSLQASRRAAIDAYEAAAAQYRLTVLQAFQNVADSLRALENDAKALQALRAAEAAAYETLAITRKQLGDGGVSYLNLLTAQQQYQQAKISRIQAQAARYADTAALFQSLGGGWWNRAKNLPVPMVTLQNRKKPAETMHKQMSNSDSFK